MKRTIEQIEKEFGPLVVKGQQVRESTLEELCAWLDAHADRLRLPMKHQLEYDNDVAVSIKYQVFNLSGLQEEGFLRTIRRKAGELAA